MKTVTEQQKRDFRTEQKYITLTFSGGATLTNEDIVLDSMSITRTLCDSEQISFGTVYASEFSIQIFNDGRKYEGQTVTVTLTAGTYTTNLGTYTVVSNPRSTDRLYRTLTAYDSIAAVLSKNYAPWHNGLKNNAPATIGAYRTAFFNYIGITQESTTLCNDSTAFTYSETSGTLSGATILGELCSINGTFGYLDFDQVFKWVTPYIDASGTLVPSLTLYPSATLYPASVDTAIESLGVDTYSVDKDNYDLGGLACEEFVTHNITQVYMHQGDVVYASGSEGNRITFSNTLFTMEPTVAVQAVANVRATVKDFNYTPTSVTMLATPWLELCDVVVAEVSETEKVYFPVLNFVITGTGAIRQTIEAKGVRVNSDDATSTDYKIITASNSAEYAADLARQAQQAATAAQTTAETAQSTAETAQESADNVAEDLANYIASCEIVVGTQTGVTGNWTGNAELFVLEDGQQIAYWLPYAGSDNATLNLTLLDETQTGPIPVYYKGATRATTHFSAGTVIHLTYRVNADVAGTTYTGWWADASYDSGNTYNRIRFENAVKAKVAITKNHLIVGDASGYFPLAANTPFDFTKPILWATADITANTTATTNYLAINSITLRNNLANVTLTQYSTCYLVGTLAGETFTPLNGQFFTSTVPTTDDGYYYVSLGYLYSTYQIYLYPEHPIYKFVDGRFMTLEQVAYEANTAAATAQETADTAQETADTAQETAETAQTTAEEAKATYGSSSTAAGTASKLVDCENFSFDEGTTLEVYFENGNTASTPTLNVNNTGDKAILVNGLAPSTYTNPLQWTANTYINFVYDGTSFNVTDSPATFTSYCYTADGTAVKVIDDIENAVIMNGAVLNVTFGEAESSALNLAIAVTGTTARRCLFEDSLVSSTNPFTWNEGSKITFTLSEGYWAITDSGATRKAIEAGKTATNYLHFSDQKGLVVSQSPVTSDTEINALTTPNSRVVSDGFDVYKNGTTRVAHFGETTIIGQSGMSQQVLDSTSLNFNAPTGSAHFTVKNGIIGHGFTQEAYVEVSDTREYLDSDGTLNISTLASLLAEMASEKTMVSESYDYVIAATTSNTTLVMSVFGYAYTNSGATNFYSLRTNLSYTLTLRNGTLTVTTSEQTSPWTNFATNFAAQFPSGSKNHFIWATFTLNYPISDIQMTLGSRQDGSRVGAKSVAVGSDNIASGTGSMAFGKGLIVTDDYSVFVGADNVEIEDAGVGNHVATAFGVGAARTTPFAVLKSGVITMSSANFGATGDNSYAAGSATDVTVNFAETYPSTPFVLLTLVEDNVNSASDYGRIQIFLKSADQYGFTATVVNGGSAAHSLSFNWCAFSVL